MAVPMTAALGGKKKSWAVSATARFGALKGGAGVLERPSFDQSQFDVAPQAEEGLLLCWSSEIVLTLLVIILALRFWMCLL